MIKTSIRLALAVLVPLSLAACATSSKSSAIVKPDLARIPESLLADCRPPVDLPESGLDVDQVVRALAADRVALGDCGSRHKALAAAARAVQAQSR